MRFVTAAERRRHMGRVLPIVIAGLVAGGAAGAGVGSGLYPPVAGVALAVVVGAITGFAVWRSARKRGEGP